MVIKVQRSDQIPKRAPTSSCATMSSSWSNDFVVQNGDDDDDYEDDGDDEEDDSDEEEEEEEEEEGGLRDKEEACETMDLSFQKLLRKREKEDKFTRFTEEGVRKKTEEKSRKMLHDNEPRWRETVRQQMETELSRRVREALETPPLERLQKRNDQARQKNSDDINSHLLIDLSERERDFLRSKRWKALQARKTGEKRELAFMSKKNIEMQFLFRDELCPSNHDQYPGVFGLGNLSEGIKNIRDDYSVSISRYPGAKPKIRHFYTKEGFLKALRTGNLPSGLQFIDDMGTYIDKYGVIRNGDGPFWPVECVPMFATPRFKWWTHLGIEPFSHHLPPTSRTIDTQVTQFKGKWRGIQVTYDSERSPRDFSVLPVPEGCCPSLGFESRFECGNLRQARRIGQFEYELVLKSDLYTARHTQWYYFRMTNVVPGITYKFRIVNLLKRDSLYNHGMRPLLYSEKEATENQKGWHRTGHHISYSRNIVNHNCPLLQRGVSYFMLEWQMEFSHAEDTYYLAHCYPYSFTDLKEDLEVMMNSEERAKVTRREVMCETRAGNSCFLLTVSNFNVQEVKKAVVITARVHPGESQASWMMKGLLEFITGPDSLAQELRNNFVFKIVPMINPDGVIVGNYRCSLAARDLNRNYRHPRRESFPTIWYLKNMVEDLARKYEIALYCDLHGHSRKPNIFMYGNNTSRVGEPSALGMARAFISERLFPWLMSTRSPDKFAFKSCKFSVRKCKESTGRVVMWRQMGVFNSFTLEATFSGTVLDTNNCRHFNILDFMSMGKILAQTVLDYSTVQEDQAQQTQVVLDLTRVITEQILVSKGLIEPNTTLPDFGVDKGVVESDAAKVRESAEKWTGALLQLLNSPHDSKKDQAKPTDTASKTTATTATTITTAATTATSVTEGEDPVRPFYTHDDVVAMLGKITGRGTKSMEDCLGILAQIEAHENMEESDSSDSDSESEPEMKAPEPKPRKKKKKSKKQRDHDKKGDKKHGDDSRAKANSALPSLSALRRGGSNSANSDNYVMGKSVKQATPDKNSSNNSAIGTSQANMKQMSGYISKYEGRHNGGVPCFTEERSMERAAKRMAEMRKKNEDEPQNRDLTFYCVDDNGIHSLSQEELNQRLMDLATSTSSPASPMMGFNVKTGYTHANNLQELNPPPHQPLNNVGSFLMSTHKNQFSFHDFDHSSSEDSESDYCNSIKNIYPGKDIVHSNSSSSSNNNRSPVKTSNNLITTTSKKSSAFTLPIAAKKNPYQHLDPLEEKVSPNSSFPLNVQNNHGTNFNTHHRGTNPNHFLGKEPFPSGSSHSASSYLTNSLSNSIPNPLSKSTNASNILTGTMSVSSSPTLPRKDSLTYLKSSNPINKSIKSDMNSTIFGGLNDYRDLKRSKTFVHSSELNPLKEGRSDSVLTSSSPSVFTQGPYGKQQSLRINPIANGAKKSPIINGSYNNSVKKSQPQNVGKLVQHLSESLMGVSTPMTSSGHRKMHFNSRESFHHLSRPSRHHLSNSSSPLMTSGINPANRMLLPDCLSPRVDDKTRIGGKTAANNIRMTRSHFSSPGAQQEFSWE